MTNKCWNFSLLKTCANRKHPKINNYQFHSCGFALTTSPTIFSTTIHRLFWIVWTLWGHKPGDFLVITWLSFHRWFCMQSARAYDDRDRTNKGGLNLPKNLCGKHSNSPVYVIKISSPCIETQVKKKSKLHSAVFNNTTEIPNKTVC